MVRAHSLGFNVRDLGLRVLVGELFAWKRPYILALVEKKPYNLNPISKILARRS